MKLGLGRQAGLVVPDKAERVRNFHDNTLMALADMLAAAGVAHPDNLGPQHLHRRISSTEVRQVSELYTFLASGALIEGGCPDPFYNSNWAMARADSFDVQ